MRLAAFLLAMLCIGLYIVVARPAWLPGPWQGLPPTTEQAVVPAPLPPLADAATPAPSCPRVRVTAVRLNLRAEPGPQTKALEQLQAGETLTVLYCESDRVVDGYTWWEVVGEDGMRGWAATQWLEEAGAQP